MRPWPGFCRTLDEIDRSDATRLACLGPFASPVQQAPPLPLRSAKGLAPLRNAFWSAECAVSLLRKSEVRIGAFAGVSGTTTARSILGNHWCRVHGHQQP